MTNQYNLKHERNRSKNVARTIIAKDIKDDGREMGCVHHLGGVSTNTPFENKFKSRRKRMRFVRYEKRKTNIPDNYLGVHVCREWDALTNSWSKQYADQFSNKTIENPWGVFYNGNFQEGYKVLLKKYKQRNNYLWLDYCGTATDIIVDNLIKNLKELSQNKWKRIFVTFLLNPRNSHSAIDISGISDRQKRAEFLLNSILDASKNSDIIGKVLITYKNGRSPMGVLRFSRREEKQKIMATIKQKTAKVTKNGNNELKSFKNKNMYDYLAQHKRGLTNAQIAKEWKLTRNQVAWLDVWCQQAGLKGRTVVK